jgi:hypothetical protein
MCQPWPMASANLDLVRSLYAAWESGDFFTDAEWAHPEIECVVADGPTPGDERELAGMATIWRDIVGACKDFRSTAEEYIEIDDGVASFVRLREG